MHNPLLSLLRKMILYRNKSNAPHGFIPLNDIHSAVIFIDPNKIESTKTYTAVRAYFDKLDIDFQIIFPTKKQLNCLGKIKKSHRVENKQQVDLFICLADIESNFAARYELVFSEARFKIGCNESNINLFDMVVLPPQGARFDQYELFNSLKDYILKIR